MTDPEEERREAIHRMLDYYLHTADAANRLLDPNRDPIVLAVPQPGITPTRLTNHDEALGWFRAEHQAILGCIEQAAAIGFGTHAWQLTWAVAHYLHRQGHWHDSTTIHGIALRTAEELGDLQGQAVIHRSLARVRARLGDFGEARTHLERAVELFGEIPDHTSRIQSYLALAWILDLQGRQQEMFDFVQQAFDEHQAAGHPIDDFTDPDEDHLLHADASELKRQLSYYRMTLQLLRYAKERYGEAHVWSSLGHAHAEQGDHNRASACYRRAHHLFQKFGDRYFEALTLARSGDSRHASGNDTDARIAWQQALEILDDLQHAHADHIRSKLSRLSQDT